MGGHETQRVAVCAPEAGELAALVEVIRGAGAWSILPVQWPNERALAAATDAAQVVVLSSRPPVDDALVRELGARREGVPLIVVGPDPAAAARPTAWLAAPEPYGALAALVVELVGPVPRARTSSPLTWRRKSDMIIGNSVQISQLLHTLDQLATAQTPVIVTGESGVGKELVARALHFCGPRANEPFIAINCAAVPEHLFEAELFGHVRGAFTGAVQARTGAVEAAEGGTLFLDEIGDMPLAMQAKLLRVLQTGEVQRIGSTERKIVKFRLVSATNRDLERDVAEGRFREDLYYRIQVCPVPVPPLRERPDDIPAIVTHHLSTIAQRESRPALRMTSAALEKLVGYGWPGNVRELINILERAVVLSEDAVIDADHVMLPTASRHAASLPAYRDAKARFELEYFSQLMRVAGGNISLAAKLGQKTRKEVYDALKRLGLDPQAYRADEEAGKPAE